MRKPSVEVGLGMEGQILYSRYKLSRKVNWAIPMFPNMTQACTKAMKQGQ